MSFNLLRVRQREPTLNNSSSLRLESIRAELSPHGAHFSRLAFSSASFPAAGFGSRVPARKIKQGKKKISFVHSPFSKKRI